MSDIDLVVTRTKILEGRLERELNAEGDGLGKKVENVKDKLPNETLEQLRKINKIRIDIVHKEGKNELEDRQEFIDLCDSVEGCFNGLVPARDLSGECLIVILAVMAAIAAIIYLSS